MPFALQNAETHLPIHLAYLKRLSAVLGSLPATTLEIGLLIA